MPPRPHAHNLRTGRYSQPNRIYLVTTVTAERLPVFTDLRLARLLVTVLREAQAETLAFVIMPDHLHWLLSLTGTMSLSRVVQQMKGRAARRINQHRGAPKPLWQAGYHDHAVRQEEDLQALARYIVANPLRACLVRRVGDYSHWDAKWL